MEAITRFSARTAVLPYDDIDTDQIIPARFLTTTTREGLGENLFRNWRFDEHGQPRADFPLNDPSTRDAGILVGGRNFGCGSSREHAPWALLDYGIRAVISTEIADIFCSNSLKNGLLPITVDEATHQWLLRNAGAELTIDLEHTTLTLPDGTAVSFPVERFARFCLMNGLDQLGYLLEHEDAIRRFEERAQ